MSPCVIIEVVAFIYVFHTDPFIRFIVGNRAIIYSQGNVGYVIFILKLYITILTCEYIICPSLVPTLALYVANPVLLACKIMNDC